MSNNQIPLLQPERGSDETQDAYKARRNSARGYVASALAGELIWSPDMQGSYVNHGKHQQRPFGKGKSAHRRFKLVKRQARLAQELKKKNDEALAEA